MLQLAILIVLQPALNCANCNIALPVFKKLNLDVNNHIVISDKYFIPNEVPELRGDATKIREILGWKPKHNLYEGLKKTYKWFIENTYYDSCK